MKSVSSHVALLLAACMGVSASAEKGVANIGRYPIEGADPADYLDQVVLPPGFSIEIYQDDAIGARSMALAEDGTLYVGTRTAPGRGRVGKVYAIPAAAGGTRGDGVMTIASDLNVPNGVALRGGDLYVAELNRIIRFANIGARLTDPPAPEVLNDTFPVKHHDWKYLRFGPDDRLYVPVGAPCNVCEVEEGIATIVSLRPDGSDKRVYASGIRNSVGMEFHPETGELWFTDNGRDIWGDDIPPEELNRAPEPGLHFGYPHRYGVDLVDEEFPTSRPASDFAAPELEFPAHNALLGLRFNTGGQFPADYHGDLFIASHGSWNRTVPDGYSIFRVRMEGGEAVEHEVFASGWLTADKEYWGRPVDVTFAADGAMLVSDDYAGVIYRISYQGQ